MVCIKLKQPRLEVVMGKFCTMHYAPSLLREPSSVLLYVLWSWLRCSSICSWQPRAIWIQHANEAGSNFGKYGNLGVCVIVMDRSFSASKVVLFYPNTNGHSLVRPSSNYTQGQTLNLFCPLHAPITWVFTFHRPAVEVYLSATVTILQQTDWRSGHKARYLSSRQIILLFTEIHRFERFDCNEAR